MTSGANDAAYGNLVKRFVYSSFDNNPEDKVIDFNEADTHSGSVFSKLDEELINNSLQQVSQQNKPTLDSIKKYFNVSLLSEIKAAFQSMDYSNTSEIQDEEHYDEAQKNIDDTLEEQIDLQLETIKKKLQAKYNAKIAEAIQTAKRQEFGVQQTPGTQQTQGAQPISYYEYDMDGNNIATFDSAGPETDEANRSQGYKTTVDNLVNNYKAKSWKREVDGQMQTIYEFKDPQTKKKVCVIVDDAGQIHKLKTTTTVGKNTYVTEDAVEMARSIVGYTTDIEVKRRKVDGQNQVVIRYKDNEGKEHVNVIDRNEVTGQISLSADLEHVSHGGKAKYASQSSGFENSPLVNPGVEGADVSVRTQKGRDFIDKEGISYAMQKLTPHVVAKGGTVTSQASSSDVSSKIYTVKINNHTYTIDSADNKNADRTMRLIMAELNSITTHQQADPMKYTLLVTEDGRGDANDVSGQSTAGQTEQNWGVDNPTNHQSNSTSVRKIGYENDFTKAQFQQEGWKRSRDGSRETKILKDMDDNSVKGNGKSVRNLKTANEFAERFLKAMGVQDLNGYNVDKLANAIRIANPSLFDANGNMYKNADFTRLNLPTDIKNYRA